MPTTDDIMIQGSIRPGRDTRRRKPDHRARYQMKQCQHGLMLGSTRGHAFIKCIRIYSKFACLVTASLTIHFVTLLSFELIYQSGHETPYSRTSELLLGPEKAEKVLWEDVVRGRKKTSVTIRSLPSLLRGCGRLRRAGRRSKRRRKLDQQSQREIAK